MGMKCGFDVAQKAMLLPYPIQRHNGKSRFTRYMYGHQNDITGVMCGWSVYIIQTLFFTKRNSEYMHDIWPLKVIHNDSIELLHYHFSKVYNCD